MYRFQHLKPEFLLIMVQISLHFTDEGTNCEQCHADYCETHDFQASTCCCVE